MTTCGTCRYLRPSPADPLNVNATVCFRYPPTAATVQTQGGIVAVTVYPPVARSMPACGEFLAEGGNAST